MTSPERIPMLTLASWVRAGAQCGVNVHVLFAEHGLSPHLSHIDSAGFDPLMVLKVLAATTRASTRGHFPFALGENFAFEHLPEIETFVATAPTLREAFRAVEWARLLINPYMELQLEERGNEAWVILKLSFPVRLHRAHVFVTEGTLMAVKKFGRSLLGPEAALLRATFKHKAPAYAAEYERCFELEPEFGARDNALVFPREYLDVPLTGAYPQLNAQAAEMVANRLARFQPRSELQSQVLALLTQEPALLASGVIGVADRLHLHPRTLQRRLKDEGLGFLDLQSAARHTLATRWLGDDGEDIDTVGERLGFSDRRSFSLAFKRWTGTTPGAWRRNRDA